ncbi:MAG: N-acetyltransferase [Bdellovibrionota bacterium]
MATSIKVKTVESKQERDDFFLLPWDIHEDDKNWVPPLLLSVKQTLDTAKNPFWKHAKQKLWVAYQGGACVGRIAGVIDESHNKFHGETTAFWGFFECINDIEVARALFSVVEAWSREQGMNVLRGPMNPSTNHECGLQINAFDTKPFIMMTQNPAYYPELVEKAGFSKAKDLYAWLLDNSRKFDDKLVQNAKRLQESQGIVVRPIDMAKYEEEIEKIIEVYNDAWEKNWGFVPMTNEEFRHMAKDMKPILVPQLVYIVEVRGETAGFSLWLPDLNQVMAKIPDGKLFPAGLIKLLWYTKVKRIVNRGRILTLGVKKKYRNLGLASLLYLRYYEDAPALGYPLGECSWILEDNAAMNQGLKLMKADLYKTYRIYDKPLTTQLN